MHVTRVTFRSELPSASQETAALEKQLDAAQKQLSKDMVSGDMIAQIIDFVDISVAAVAAAIAPSIAPTSGVSTTVQVPDAVPTPDVSAPDVSAPDPASAALPASTVVYQPDPLSPVAPGVDVAAPTRTASSAKPGA